MPNLEQTAVTDWLTEIRSSTAPAWPPPVRPVELQAGAPAKLSALGALLDEMVSFDPQALTSALVSPALREDLAGVMAQLGGARALRLLSWLTEIDLPNHYAVVRGLVTDAGQSSAALRASVSALTRAAVLRRMFAGDRMEALEAACAAMMGEMA